MNAQPRRRGRAESRSPTGGTGGHTGSEVRTAAQAGRLGRLGHGFIMDQTYPSLCFRNAPFVQDAFTFPLPDGVPPDQAVFTEPLAIALHAVRRGATSARPGPAATKNPCSQ